MDQNKLLQLMQDIQAGRLTPDSAVQKLKTLPFEDLQYAKVDHHRELRNGFPEVVFCPGKTVAQIRGIIEKLLAHGDGTILATRATEEIYREIRTLAPEAIWHEPARIVEIRRNTASVEGMEVLVMTAGTSDIPVAEEAAVTAEAMGNPVKRLYDVGVAGIHRLMAYKNLLDEAGIIIVVAGMEGALASVVGGLVDKPVIAVPSSIGYGTSFGGMTPLFSMLNSCANGIGVMNIDNGYGAACLATRINRAWSQGRP